MSVWESPATKKAREKREKKAARAAARESAREDKSSNLVATNTVDPFSEHFLSVSAIWFDGTVFDTSDISTTRGASLALLFAPDCLLVHLQQAFEKEWAFETIISGASKLFLKCSPKTDAGTILRPANDIYQTAVDFLSSDQDLTAAFPKRQKAQLAGTQCHVNLANLRFSVALVPSQTFSGIPGVTISEGKALSGDTNLLLAANTVTAFNQYQTLSVIAPLLPAKTDDAPSMANICALDGVQPATEKDREKIVSAPVVNRRKFGRDRKKDFYLNILKDSTDARKDRLIETISKLDFSQSLSDLLEYADGVNAEGQKSILRIPPNLGGKIAVIHLDGNKFGSLLSSRSRINDQSLFSTEVRRLQADMLVELLDWILPADREISVDQNDFLAFPDNSKALSSSTPLRIRLETLVWGGDEMVFALPAWRGWEALSVLERALRKFEITWGDNNTEKLTHAVGLCFANAKTPIRLLHKMADDLATDAKQVNTGSNTSFAFSVGIVEGVDVPNNDVVDLRATQFGNPSSSLRFVGSPAGTDYTDWAKITADFLQLKIDLPPSLASRLLSDATKLGLGNIRPGGNKFEGWSDTLKKELKRVMGDHSDRYKRVTEFFQKPDWEGDQLIPIQWARYIDGFLPGTPRDADIIAQRDNSSPKAEK